LGLEEAIPDRGIIVVSLTTGDRAEWEQEFARNQEAHTVVVEPTSETPPERIAAAEDFAESHGLNFHVADSGSSELP